MVRYLDFGANGSKNEDRKQQKNTQMNATRYHEASKNEIKEVNEEFKKLLRERTLL